MRILQFVCVPNPPAEQLKQLTVDQLNTWSRLRWLSTDPNYVTAPYDASIWQAHQTIPGLWWLDYDSLHTHVGDDGRVIADQMLGTGPLQGILRLAPLVQELPGTRLELVDVDDPVAAGYVAETA
jgi:hypothetical protein